MYIEGRAVEVLDAEISPGVFILYLNANIGLGKTRYPVCSSAECLYRVRDSLYLPVRFGSRVKIRKARRMEKFGCWSIGNFTACEYVASASDVEVVARYNITSCICL